MTLKYAPFRRTARRKKFGEVSEWLPVDKVDMKSTQSVLRTASKH